MLLYLTYTCYEEGLVNSFVDPIVRVLKKMARRDAGNAQKEVYFNNRYIYKMIFYIDILYLFLFYLCRSTRIPLVQVTLFFCCCCRSGGRRCCCCGLNDRIILLYFPLVSLLFAVSTAAPTNRFAVA